MRSSCQGKRAAGFLSYVLNSSVREKDNPGSIPVRPVVVLFVVCSVFPVVLFCSKTSCSASPLECVSGVCLVERQACLMCYSLLLTGVFFAPTHRGERGVHQRLSGKLRLFPFVVG